MPSDNDLGPVDIAVIEFPGSQFKGEIAPALRDLVDSGTVTILDLFFVMKEDDGSLTGLELSEVDADTAAAFNDVDGEVNGLLSDEDMVLAGEALSPGSSALMLVWENTWARKVVDAVQNAGGRLVAHDRLDAETVRAAMAASSED
jgi:hypothetical protein